MGDRTSKRPSENAGRGLRGIARRGPVFVGVLVLMSAAAGLAGADERISDVRTSRQPGYDRIVFDLSSDLAPAYATTRGLLLEAELDALPEARRRALSDLGVRLERTPRGTRVTVDGSASIRRTAFRLSGARPRIVLDIGAGAPGVPGDGGEIPDASPDVIARWDAPDDRAASRDLVGVGAAGPEPARAAASSAPSERQNATERQDGTGAATRRPAEPPAATRAATRAPAEAAKSAATDRPTAAARTPRPPVDASPKAATTRPNAATPSRTAEPEPFRVLVSGVSFPDLPAAGPSREEILDVRLSVRRASTGGWEAAGSASDAQTLTVRELAAASGDSGLHGSAIQQLVEQIAALYMDYGRVGTRVDIRRADLEPLLLERGTLVVRISDPAETDEPE